jgi:imidazolonepropionase-like amidohydrolase
MAEMNVKLLVGHDGYDSEFTFREMEAFHQVGVPEVEIIKAATLYPAEWLGLTELFGSLTANRKANILVLDKNPLDHITNIRSRSMVLKEGQIVYQKGED